VLSLENQIHYRLNERDEIVYVNAAWDTFASENSGAHLSANRVLGRPLWDFITDGTTETLYRDLLARVRDGRRVRFAFRCDSPDRRRRLEMEVSHAERGWAEFRVRTLSEEIRQWQSLLDPERSRAAELLRLCGWCKKVDVDSRWVEVEEAVSVLELFDRTSLPDVTHGICEGCYSQMAATLEEGKERLIADHRGGLRWAASRV
jgi:hypothetical protein